MELALNLGWMMLATTLCWLWARHAQRKNRDRWAQFVSLGLVLLMMFVVITMYDDMAMTQKSAETRSFQREDDAGTHTPFHPVLASTPTQAKELYFNSSRYAVPGSFVVSTATDPALSSIQNRPPPAA